MAAVQVRPAVTAYKPLGLGRWIRVLALTGLLAACVAPGSPMVTDRSLSKSGQTTYTVARGDTLYSIAWRFDLDYRRFAAANQIGPPFTIYPGQKLRLTDVTSPAATTTRARAAAANAPSKSAVAQKPSVTKTKGIDGKALTESTLCNLSLAGFGPPLKLIWNWIVQSKARHRDLGGTTCRSQKKNYASLSKKRSPAAPRVKCWLNLDLSRKASRL